MTETSYKHLATALGLLAFADEMIVSKARRLKEQTRLYKEAQYETIRKQRS